MIRGEPTATAGAPDIGLAADGDTRVPATPGSAGARRGQQALDGGSGPVQLPLMHDERALGDGGVISFASGDRGCSPL